MIFDMRRVTPTQHQIEILLLSARCGEKVAANEMGISIQTVKNTLSHVYRKLEAHSMAHAILILAERGDIARA